MFKDLIKNLRDKRLKVLVVGDAMIDEFYNVDVSRISPEFPIPVNKSKTEYPVKSLPGGAANVAYQFKNFNVDVKLCSFIDNESCRVFNAHGIDTSMSVFIIYKIPRKRRFYDGDFPLFRWDIETENYGLEEKFLIKFREELLAGVRSSAWKPDVIVFSDYGKGVFGSFNDSWTRLTGIKIVDPKNPPAKAWRGCNIFKPNIKEAREMVSPSVRNTEDFEELLYELSNSVSDQYHIPPEIVMTDSGNGVYTYYSKEKLESCLSETFGLEHYCSNKKVNVQSVSGAGDCFVSFLAMAIGSGFNIREASKIAYEAGSLYVQKLHNSPLYPLDLIGKIVNPEDLINRDFKLVFTNGCFDIIHSGHLHTLRYAKNQGDKLVVALNTDESVKRLKGESRPIKSLEERMNVMASLEFVDYVVPFSEDTPKEILEMIIPDVLVKAGYDLEDIVGTDIVKETLIAPMIDGVSTTKLLGDSNGSR